MQDAMGKRTVITLTNAGNNYPTSYAYNADNQLAVVTGTQGVARYSYDAAGRLQQLTLPNALTTNYSYDGLSRLTNLHQDSPYGPLTAYSYTLDLNGNKTQAQEWVGGQAGYTRWQYNAGQRLALEAQLDGSAITQTTTSYLYAPTGNRLSVTTNGSTTSYGYNRLDQLTVITNPNSTYVYQNYDGRGNLYQTVDGGNTTNYSYDYANRMVGASVPGHSVSYGYDAGGHRVQQTVDGNATNYLWDEQGYGEVGLEQSGGTTTNYLLAGGQRLAVTSGSLTNYYLPDGLGNIRTLAGSSGNLTSDRYQYDAYGSLLPGSVTATQNAYRYKGQQYDQATGLYNLRARYYNSTQGRFLSQDKAGYDFENPVELNRYGYAEQNPVTSYDPTGYTSLAQYRAALGAVAAPAVGVVYRLGQVVEERYEALLSAGRAGWFRFAVNQLGGSNQRLTTAETFIQKGENGPIELEAFAINASATLAQKNIARQIVGQLDGVDGIEVILIEGAEDFHAERRIYEEFVGNPGFKTIGVSNFKGPCSDPGYACMNYFVNVRFDPSWWNRAIPGGLPLGTDFIRDIWHNPNIPPTIGRGLYY